MTTARPEPGYRGYLTENTVTLAEVLKDAGYHTAMSGKWHVSNTVEQPTKEAQQKWLNHQASHPYFSPLEQYPVSRGFEQYYGNIFGVVDYFDPFSLVNGTTPVDKVPAIIIIQMPSTTRLSAISRRSARKTNLSSCTLRKQRRTGRCRHYLEDIKKYENTYKVDWDTIREARYNKMVKQGLIDPATTPLSPRINKELSWDKNLIRNGTQGHGRSCRHGRPYGSGHWPYHPGIT